MDGEGHSITLPKWHNLRTALHAWAAYLVQNGPGTQQDRWERMVVILPTLLI